MGQRITGAVVAAAIALGGAWLMARRAPASEPGRAEKWIAGSGAVATVLAATVVQGIVESQMKAHPDVDLSWIGIKLLASGLATAFAVFLVASLSGKTT